MQRASWFVCGSAGLQAGVVTADLKVGTTEERLVMSKVFWISMLLAMLACAGSRTAAAQVPTQHTHRYDGPPLSLDDAVKAAVAQNLDVIVLRRQLEVLRLRPGQEHSLP